MQISFFPWYNICYSETRMANILFLSYWNLKSAVPQAIGQCMKSDVDEVRKKGCLVELIMIALWRQWIENIYSNKDKRSK